MRVDQLAGPIAAQRDRGGVDREVPTLQVEVDWGGRHDRQRSRRRIAFAARAGQVDARAVRERDAGGSEAVVDCGSGSGGLGERAMQWRGIAVVSQVEVEVAGFADGLIEQQIANHASGHVEVSLSELGQMT